MALRGLAVACGPEVALQRGLEFLEEAWRGVPPSSPIGLYFARLLYDEALYPLVFSLTAVATLAAHEPLADASAPGTPVTPSPARAAP